MTPADSMLWSPSRIHKGGSLPPQLLEYLELPTGFYLEAGPVPGQGCSSWVVPSIPRLWSTHDKVAAPWQCLAVEGVKSKAKVPRGI